MVESTKQLAKWLYTHSFVRYALVGGITFAVDFLLLVLLHGVLDVKLLVAATISYWTSIAFNFLTNRIWTFGATESPMLEHLALYTSLLAFNYLFTIGFIAAATNMGMHYTIAKILATGVQILWTYIAYKKIIFK